MDIYDDDGFMEMREEAHKFMKDKEESVIREWLDGIGFKGTVGYYRDISNNVMEIYTTRPGVLIGKYGCGVEALIHILSREFRGTWKVRFTEIRGGIVSVGQ